MVFLRALGPKLVKWLIIPILAWLVVSAVISAFKKGAQIVRDSQSYEQQVEINKNLKAENARLEKRNEDDRIRDKKIRDEFRAKEYEEINRYKRIAAKSQEALDFYGLPIPDDVGRVRISSGAFHSEQHIPEGSDRRQGVAE